MNNLYQYVIKYRRLIIVALGICLLLASNTRPAVASPNPIAYQGITLTPAIRNVDLRKGQTAANFTIAVTNNTKKDVTLNAASVDFKSLNATGGVAFIGNTAGVVHKYGLASWLDVPKASIQLKPNQTKPVPISVENRADLAPGGHYAAVLFKAADSGPVGQNHVDISRVVSVLIFVRKIDGEQFGINLSKPAVPTSWVHLPTNLDLFFKNTGNVQTVPRGLVTIISPRGREVARGIINTDSSLVLPESTRLNRTALFNTSHAWLPGFYRVLVQYRSDGSAALNTYQGSFLYVNVLSVGLGLGGLIVLGLIVRQSAKIYRQHTRRK